MAGTPEAIIPFECERSRASNQMGAAAIVGTFCGESITVLTQRQPTFARMHLVTHRSSSGAGYETSVARRNTTIPLFRIFLREVREG